MEVASSLLSAESHNAKRSGLVMGRQKLRYSVVDPGSGSAAHHMICLIVDRRLLVVERGLLLVRHRKTSRASCTNHARQCGSRYAI